MNRLLVAALVTMPLVLGPASSFGQDYDRPPPGYGDDNAGGSGSGGAVDMPDPGALQVRVSRLESRIREMTGQLEELQNANRKLVDQFQKFQADVEGRLASGAGRQRHSENDASKFASADGADAAASGEDTRPRRSHRDDAFDPNKAAVGTPGRPKPLGSSSSATADNGDGAPMDLSGGRFNQSAADGGAIAPTLRLPSAAPKAIDGGTAVASAEPGPVPTTPRGEFDAALGLYRDKQYDQAEKSFTAFIQKNPKSKLAADATYYLGESFAQRGRSREAAEQYLKISTDYANSSRAPDAMLHLGMSLRALGAKEQACATFSEVPRKYPNAPTYVRTGAEREAKRAQC